MLLLSDRKALIYGFQRVGDELAMQISIKFGGGTFLMVALIRLYCLKFRVFRNICSGIFEVGVDHSHYWLS